VTKHERPMPNALVLWRTIDRAAMTLLMLLTVLLLLFISDRGLDLADESYCVLMIEMPTEMIGSASGFGHVLHPVYRLLGGDLVLFRRTCIIMLVGAGGLLGLATNRYLHSISRPRVEGMCPLMGTTALLAYAWGVLTPGYDWLNLLGMLIALLALLEIGAAAAVTHDDSVTKVLLLTAISAFGSVIAFFAKPTTGFCMFCFCVSWLFLLKKQRKAWLISYLLSVPLIFFTLATLLWGSLPIYLAFTARGLTMASYISKTFSPFSIPIRAVQALYQGLRSIARSVVYSQVTSVTLAILLITMSLAMWRNGATAMVGRLRALRRWSSWGGVLMWISLLAGGNLKGGHPQAAGKGFLLGVSFVPAATTVFVCTLLRQGSRSECPRDVKREWALILAVCCLPVMYWLGSSNGPIAMSLLAGVFFVLGAILLLTLAGTDEGNPASIVMYRYCIMVVTFVILLSMTFRLYVLGTTKVEQSAYSMNQRFVLAGGCTLKVSRDLADYLRRQRDVGRKAGVTAGDYLINLTGANSGVNLVWGTRPLGSPWFLGSEALAIAAINAHSRETVSGSWVLTSDPMGERGHAPMWPVPPDVLEECGLSFPDDYREVGQAFNPITCAMEILWRPDTRRD